jgi:hypothetical protein
MAASRSEMAAIIPPAPIRIVRREVPVSVKGLALVTSVSTFMYDPSRTPKGIGCDTKMRPTAKVPYCTMVSPILWDRSAWRPAFALPSPARRHSFNRRIACSSPRTDTKV